LKLQRQFQCPTEKPRRMSAATTARQSSKKIHRSLRRKLITSSSRPARQSRSSARCLVAVLTQPRRSKSVVFQ